MLVSVIFLLAILGPETAVPILRAPGKIVFFLQENLHAHKIPCFRGFIFFWGGGGGGVFFFLNGREDFLNRKLLPSSL